MNLRSTIKTAVYQALSTPGTSSPTATPSSKSFGASQNYSNPSSTSSPICICDSLNYVRGYRYELFCIARQFVTTYCIVYCKQPIIDSYLWNDSDERSTNKYPDDLFIDLWSRFEVPKAENHWERPLFHIQPVKSFASSISNFPPQIISFLPHSIFRGKKKTVNKFIRPKNVEKIEIEDLILEDESDNKILGGGYVDDYIYDGDDDEDDEEEWNYCVKMIDALEERKSTYVEEKKKKFISEENDDDVFDDEIKEIDKKDGGNTVDINKIKKEKERKEREKQKEFEEKFQGFLFPVADDQMIQEYLSTGLSFLLVFYLLSVYLFLLFILLFICLYLFIICLFIYISNSIFRH
jgi:tRNA uridine 5-carbamoylmethylation protein Kti12